MRYWLGVMLCTVLGGFVCGSLHADPPVYGPATLVPELSGFSNTETINHLSFDGTRIVLHAQTPSSGGRFLLHSASRSGPGAPFSAPSTAGFTIPNTAGFNIEYGIVSANGLELFFSHPRDPYGDPRYFSRSLWGVFSGVPQFGPAAPVVESIVLPGAWHRPSWISPDGLRVYYFVQPTLALPPTTFGGSDLYVIERASIGSFFGLPTPAPFVNINTSGYAEVSPRLTPDELQVFFYSNRPGGVGSSDIWWAERPDTSSPFGAPVNLTSLNTSFSEHNVVIFEDEIFFNSNRGPDGTTNVYTARRIVANSEPQVSCPGGVVAECVDGGAIVLVQAEVFDADGDPLDIEWRITYPDGSTTIVTDTVTFSDPPAPIDIELIDPDGTPAGAFFFPHDNTSVELHVWDGTAEAHACSPVTIMVKDTQGPLIVTLVELIEVGNDRGQCYATVDLTSPEYAPVFSDLCSQDVSAKHNAPEAFRFPIGETTVTWTVDDGHGNTTLALQTVIVHDVEPPSAIAPPDVTVAHDAGDCVATSVSLGLPSASDNCGIDRVYNDAPSAFPLGETEVTWFIIDTSGNAALVTQHVFVTNADPIPNAGDNRIVECTSPDGASVQLDARGSTDPDSGDILSYQWSAVGVTFDDPTSVMPTAQFPMGATTVSLEVSDQCGAVGSTDVIVVVEDHTAPQIQAITTDQQVLWPPDHDFVPIRVELLVRDTCESPEDLKVACLVSSNEPDDALGDGSTTGDVNGSDGYSSHVPLTLKYDAASGSWIGVLCLRAERNGGSDARKYSLVCTVLDQSGNSSSATACVVVPRDRRALK